MKEAKGNMLFMDCDALVITTNGFVKANGEAVMGRGIAKQVSDRLPGIKYLLGQHLKSVGNTVHVMCTHQQIDLISFPVKPQSVIYDGYNIVEHAKKQFSIGDRVPGFYAKAVLVLIVESAYRLVALADSKPWETVLVPRFGCGAGELEWTLVGPLVKEILDDRFIACTF